ncbi:unnamed protein product [Bursaphelenchus xylophilus]|uniref:(pine wood nematode) hypothetical protein n=1 Tax=Bursaphelenchus xylophilus TaxID=6326 RepID=A0A1I7RUA7_BURXY|nr:unnamed protein product [Bursaphelenchus xylophilus]CAG9113989.1 unnamed protein product [Bursaphelenchus xylophilus]
MKFVLAILLLLAVVTATQLNIKNNCGNAIDVVRTENGVQPVVHCRLAPGKSCGASFGGGRGMNFKNGFGGKTLAEFSFGNRDGNDYYDLSVIVGYDVGMRLQSRDRTLNCFQPRCPDAYLFPNDNSKNHGIKTGGAFTLTFCK